MLVHLRVTSDPEENVVGVLTQGMVFEASFKYGDRFAKRLKWFGLLVVEKTWLMCRWTVVVSCEVTCEFKLHKTHSK